MNERRQTQRESLQQAIEFSIPVVEFKQSTRVRLRGVITDITTQGLGITTDYPLAEGQVLLFGKEIEGHQCGIVKWVVKVEGGYKAGLRLK